MMRLFPTLAALLAFAAFAAFAACTRAPHPHVEDRARVQAVVVAAPPASVSGAVLVGDPTGDARIVADLERVSGECQADPCAAGVAWTAAAAGHERAVMGILERKAASERDDNAQRLAATALFNAQQRRELPDDVGRRLFAVAAARQPPQNLSALLALLVVGVDAERLGLTDELRNMATRWPDTPFQSMFVERLRVSFPASLVRVQILRSFFAHGSLDLETSAIDALADDTTTLSHAACEALAYGRRTAMLDRDLAPDRAEPATTLADPGRSDEQRAHLPRRWLGGAATHAALGSRSKSARRSLRGRPHDHRLVTFQRGAPLETAARAGSRRVRGVAPG